MVQTPVEIVKPGGTGSPAFVISASPEPLPPSTSFMLRLPSALPLPKKKIDLPVFAMKLRLRCDDFRYITQLQNQPLEPPHEPQTSLAQFLVVGHHQDFLEERRDGRFEAGG